MLKLNLGRIDFIQRTMRFWLWVFKQFINSDSLARAASLALTSLLAMVPFLILMMTLLSLIPDSDVLSQKVQAFIFNNFAPQTGEVIGHHLKALIDRKIGLPIVVLVFLFFVSIFMIRSIDQAINSIWQVENKRSFVNSFLLYWAIITLGPLLFGLGLGFSSYFLSLKWVDDWTFQGAGKLILFLPSVFYFVAFVFLYRVIPFVKVKLSHAVVGGLVAVILFETLKYGFTLYVSVVPTYEVIYGALVAIPLFMLWVLLCWYIFLIGAIVVKGLHLSQAQRSVYQMASFHIAMEVIKNLYTNANKGHTATFSDLLKHMPSVSVDDLKRVLNLMVNKQLIYQDGDHYLLSCQLDHVYFDGLYSALGLYIPSNKDQNSLSIEFNTVFKDLMHQPVVRLLGIGKNEQK
ncbi:YihY family inner membrane protein [Thiotrichales bacterium 19S11-10]|nr:YihY family inner membrane protein [Thiotrichales bacterium 19S11-10]